MKPSWMSLLVGGEILSSYQCAGAVNGGNEVKCNEEELP